MRLVLACLLATAAIVAADAQPPAAPSGPIVVLNLETVLNNAKLFTVRADALKKEGADAEQQLKEMDKQEQAIKDKLDVLSPKHPEAGQLQDQLELLRFKKKSFYERTRRTLDRAHAELLTTAYEQVRGHLRAFAEERGHKLVLLAPSNRVSGSNVQEVLLQLGQQSVLVHDAALDITAPFVAYLNARFAGDAAPAPAGAQGEGAATGTR